MNRFDRFLSFNEKMLSCGGLQKNQTRKQRFLRYYIIGFLALYSILAESCQLLRSSFDLRSAVRTLQITIPSLCGIGEYFNYVLHFNTVYKLYCYILNDWQKLKDETELKIMQKYARYSNIFGFLLTTLFYGYISIIILTPLLRILMTTNEIRNDLDLYPIISCFDYFSNRSSYYYPVVIYQVLTCCIVAPIVCACYTKYFLFIMHACARLSIIKNKVCSKFTSNSYNGQILVTPIDCSPWIIDIVQCLAETTEFINAVNSAFESNYILQMSLAFFALMLDFLCFPVLLEHKASINDIGTFSIYIVGTLSMIYVHCYVGQIIMDYSTEVYREVSLVPIHHMSVKAQKLLLTTLSICSKPYVITIGKFYVLSHDFFSNLVRSSLSYAIVVHSLQTI